MKEKLKNYLLFTKFRLSVLVIVSALSGYLFARLHYVDYFQEIGLVVNNAWLDIIYLMLGGILVTAASNGSNQIWEREIDILMNRTKNRPLPVDKMTVLEGFIVVIVALFVGLFLLYQLNFYSAVLGFVAFLSYVFIYTPMKRWSPWAVIVGAFPGAIPPMLGAIAFTNEFGALPGALFFVQFVWQLPHFWAIAWVSHDDYQRGGFYLLPSASGKSKTSAFRIALSAIMLIPFSLAPWFMEDQIGPFVGSFSVVAASVLGLLFFLPAYKLYLTLEDKDAKRLMFASFIYLPLIQFMYVVDKAFFM
jgi:protoheme IX farnesyltransferase